MLKQGAHPGTIHQHLVARGMSDADARGVIDELLALKRQAEASDPERLREEAKWMLMQGRTVEQVVQRFAAAGIAEEHARPEAERLLALVRRMQPCERCQSPMLVSEAFFDPAGRRVCRTCHGRDEVGASERRALASDLEELGVPAVMLSPMRGVHGPEASVPVCPRCRVPGVHPSAVHPEARRQIHPAWSFVCPRCLGGLR